MEMRSKIDFTSDILESRRKGLTTNFLGTAVDRTLTNQYDTQLCHVSSIVLDLWVN